MCEDFCEDLKEHVHEGLCELCEDFHESVKDCARRWPQCATVGYR